MMTTDVFMQILQWLVPVGSAGAVVTWLARRDTRKDRAVKEKNDIYKEMYDNISGTLIELQNENKKLYRAISRLERAIGKAAACRYFAGCPMRSELQERTDGTVGHDIRPVRQPAKRKEGRNVAAGGGGPGGKGQAEPADGQRGHAAAGRLVHRQAGTGIRPGGE